MAVPTYSVPTYSVARNRDQMRVVGHQAIADDCHAGGFAPLAEQVEIHPAVVIDEEDILPIVAALRDVMRAMRG